ncbi:MAG: hypothetical protein LBK26_02285 [Rickettsiales bacterium]|jgi:hypothetical protein|nr:hypothetical protein [Rickettsiales bacterium]
MSLDYTDTLAELQGRIDISAIHAADASELITAADRALRANAQAVLVDADAVHTIWAWLENKGVHIFALQKHDGGKEKGGKGTVDQYSNLIPRINSILKRGADGIVLQTSDNLSDLASAISPVRQDLFFGKRLIVGLDVRDIKPIEWPEIFDNLKKIGADGLQLSAAADKREGQGDVAGAIFGMLNSWDKDFAGAVCFDFRKFDDMENAWRLICGMRPELKNKVRFFVK